MDDASDVHGWVSDAAKVLDIEERRALNAVCEELRDSNVEAVQLKVPIFLVWKRQFRQESLFFPSFDIKKNWFKDTAKHWRFSEEDARRQWRLNRKKNKKTKKHKTKKSTELTELSIKNNLTVKNKCWNAVCCDHFRRLPWWSWRPWHQRCRRPAASVPRCWIFGAWDILGSTRDCPSNVEV